MNHQPAAPHLVRFIEKWAAKSRADARKDGYATLALMLNISHDGISKPEFKIMLEHYLERQIILVKYVASCFLIDSQSLAATKQLVSLQRYDRIPTLSDPCYTVYFHLLDGISQPFILVKDFKDALFADVYSVTIFPAVSVTHPDPGWLTKKNQRYFLTCFLKNLKYDGFEVDLFEPCPLKEFGPINNNRVLRVNCWIEGMPTGDNLIRINHAQKLFKMNVMKWFDPRS